MTKEEREFFLFWLILNGGTRWTAEVGLIYEGCTSDKIRFCSDLRAAGWITEEHGTRKMTDKCKQELQDDGTDA